MTVESKSKKTANSCAESALLEVEGLVCGYSGEAVVGPVDFAVTHREILLLEGGNGVGKSTLLKTVIGLIEPIGGRFRWAIDSSDRRFVPQTRTLDPMLPATVYDVLTTGLHRGGGLGSVRIDPDRERLRSNLERVGLGGFGDHLFRELSEGQKQLVLLGRALLGEPKALLLDEPTASMDPEHEQRAMDLLGELNEKSGMSVVMVAHGSPPARGVSDRIVTIGRDGTTRDA